MFCTNCGNQINNGSNFCTNCGKQIDAGIQETIQTHKTIKAIFHREKQLTGALIQ